MPISRTIADLLFRATSSQRLTFHTAVKRYRPIALALARKKSDSVRETLKYTSKHIIDATNPKTMSAWTSVFFPAEILSLFNIYALTLEVVAGMMSNLGLAQRLLDNADADEIPSTMCSFHRMLIAFSNAGIMKKPNAVCATSLMCDGNLKSFGDAAKKQNVPFFYIDIPFEKSKESVKYVKNQLDEICGRLSELTGIAVSKDKLREMAVNANKAFKLSKEFYDLNIKSDGNTFAGHEIANFAFPLHFMLGRPELCKMLEARIEDLKKGKSYNKFFKSRNISPNAKRFMWLHIVMQYPTKFWQTADNGLTSKVVCDEYSSPYFEAYNEDDPLSSIAERLISHPSNGPLSRRIEHIEKIARDFNVDGIVHYSSWGCHQAAGNVSLLGEKLQNKGFKFLNLNSDPVDERNQSLEQMKTRFEAFIEGM